MLFTRCSQDYFIHTLFTPCSQEGPASLKLQSKLDRKSVVPRSIDIVRADHGPADNLQASSPRRSHQVAVAYSEMDSKRILGKGRCGHVEQATLKPLSGPMRLPDLCSTSVARRDVQPDHARAPGRPVWVPTRSIKGQAISAVAVAELRESSGSCGWSPRRCPLPSA